MGGVKCVTSQPQAIFVIPSQQLSLGISRNLLSSGGSAETNSLIMQESDRREVVLSGSKD